ncbi:MAG: type II secretion system minor pseudopilin GspH [Proteobacteria bacterium]|nr:type II secretion system minor pseudopilin GspH [Pseudomonadota bacterium]
MKRWIRASRPARRRGAQRTRLRQDAVPAAHRLRRGPPSTCASRLRAAGFTLLEILVVVLIIGIMTAVMVLSMNFSGHDTELRTESKRLLALMKYTRDQAELQTRNYGIVFGRHGYEFVVYGVRSGAWRQVFEDEVLRERTLPPGLDFKLVVDARSIVLHDKLEVPSASGRSSAKKAHAGGADSNTSPAPGSQAGADSGSASASDSTEFAPQVMIFSSGDLSSFKITVERPSTGRSITLHVDQNGDIVEKPTGEKRS